MCDCKNCSCAKKEVDPVMKLIDELEDEILEYRSPVVRVVIAKLRYAYLDVVKHVKNLESN